MELTLLERGRFIVKLSDNTEHKGRFCAGAVDRFCSLMEVPDILAFYEKIGSMRLKDHAQFIICAMEHEQETEGRYTVQQVVDWIDDEFGGVLGEKWIAMLRHESKSLRTPEKKMPEIDTPKREMAKPMTTKKR